jgi:hypothetical protein
MTSFPQLLFSLWESKSSGCLRIQGQKIQKELNLTDGNIAVNEASFHAPRLLEHLNKRKTLSAASIKKNANYSKEHNLSLLTSLLELNIVTPPELWRHMDNFVKQEYFPLFDLFPFESSLDPESTLPESSILFTIPTLNLIHEGIYHMKSLDLIDDQIPPESKDIQKLTPDYIDFILLKPPETYILKAISEGQDLQSLYASSFLGKKAAKKTIFALFCLGILGTHPMTTPNKPLQEFSAAELRKILDTFNAKCSYIYKYISKKLGPVALNLLEKSIEDTKPNLSPPFQNVSLGADGKIDLQSVVKSNVILSDLEARQMFIKSLNEILTAEILAVKKTLGKDLESSLIKNLEKIGA